MSSKILAGGIAVMLGLVSANALAERPGTPGKFGQMWVNGHTLALKRMRGPNRARQLEVNSKLLVTGKNSATIYGDCALPESMRLINLMGGRFNSMTRAADGKYQVTFEAPKGSTLGRIGQIVSRKRTPPPVVKPEPPKPQPGSGSGSGSGSRPSTGYRQPYPPLSPGVHVYEVPAGSMIWPGR
jgi:hypothetical protein